MTPQEKLENFICDKDAFKKWWNAATDVTGDEHTAWLAWRAAIIHAEIENAKATPTADTGLEREIERIVHDAVDRCNPSTDGERFCLYNIIEGAVKSALSTREQEVGEVVEAWDMLMERQVSVFTTTRVTVDRDAYMRMVNAVAALDKVRGRG